MFFQQMLTLLTESSQLISDRISLHKRPSVWPLSRRFYIAPSLLIESRQQVLVVEESCLPRGGRILKRVDILQAPETSTACLDHPCQYGPDLLLAC